MNSFSRMVNQLVKVKLYYFNEQQPLNSESSAQSESPSPESVISVSAECGWVGGGGSGDGGGRDAVFQCVCLLAD